MASGTEDKAVFTVLPEVVWYTMFEKMDPEVLEASSHASPVLRNMLTPQRNEYLFAMVLPLLAKSEPERNLCVNLFLKCRRVCPSWCKTVDKFLEFKPIVSHPSGYRISYPMTKAGGLGRVIRDVKFLDHFQSTHDPIEGCRSPFIGTSLMVEEISFRNFNASIYCDRDTIFPLYGQHVRHVKFTKSVNQHGNYRIFEYLPNLESLCIANYENEERRRRLEKDDARQEEWQDFPQFRKLTYLKGVGVSPYLLGALLSKAPNLINLLVTTIAEAVIEDDILVPRATLPRLEDWTLDTRMISYGRTTDILVPFRTLWAHAGLKITSLDLFLPHSIVTANHMHLFWQAHPLDLPCLKILKLYTKHWPCLDFALSFRNTLEEIYARVSTESPPERWTSQCIPTNAEESIRYLDRFQNMEASNVWELLPMLKKFTINHWLNFMYGLIKTIELCWTKDPDFKRNVTRSDVGKSEDMNLL